jgi:hypothetical protein
VIVDALMLLAQHGGGEKTLWDPTILGVLVVISAIGLFCGSVYLLLATNLGARLGFLVAGACLSGFMMLLSTSWMITATPLNSPHGRIAGWNIKEVVPTLEDSRYEALQEAAGTAEQLDTAEIATIRPAIDAGLVVPTAESGLEASEFAQFEAANEFLVGTEGLAAFEVGGGTKNLFFHHPRYAAIEMCTAALDEDDFGDDQPTDECDELAGTQWVILQRDLGTLRATPFLYFAVSGIVFGLCLLGLHWYEKDRRRRREAPVPVPVATAPPGDDDRVPTS